MEAQRDGLAAGEDLDVLRAHDRQPERLRHGLLGAEARGQVLAGARAGRGVGALAGGEQAVGERRPPLERALEPIDLQQVEPDAAHATVTTLPRPRARPLPTWPTMPHITPAYGAITPDPPKTSCRCNYNGS